jgi:hypothetical protein
MNFFLQQHDDVHLKNQLIFPLAMTNLSCNIHCRC